MSAAIRISKAEWEVMVVVWEHSPVAASTVFEVLEKKHHWTLTTVRTLLRRLVNKGALRQQSEGKRYLYAPLVSRETCVQQESESFLSRVLDRMPSAAVIHLVEKANLSRADIQELRRILRRKEQ